MAYKNNIPQPTDQLSVSQGDLLNNFSAIAAAFNLNHVNFNASAQGKHAFVELVTQSPKPTTAAGEVGLYSQSSSFTSQPELAIQKQTGGVSYEFTSAGYVVGTAAVPGWAVLPSGILLKWGTTTTNGAGNATVTLNAAGQPTYSACYICIPTANFALGVSNIVQFSSFTGTASAIFFSNTGNVSFSFLVIGLSSST